MTALLKGKPLEYLVVMVAALFDAIWNSMIKKGALTAGVLSISAYVAALSTRRTSFNPSITSVHRLLHWFFCSVIVNISSASLMLNKLEKGTGRTPNLPL
jgi:hypothetical protein